MDRLEDELRRALRREQPSDDFAGRVLARAAQAEERRSWNFFRVPGLRWAVAGALAMMMVAAGFEYQQKREERLRGEAARAQLLTALRIAGSKLQFTQARVQQLQGSNRNSNTESVQ